MNGVLYLRTLLLPTSILPVVIYAPEIQYVVHKVVSKQKGNMQLCIVYVQS